MFDQHWTNIFCCLIMWVDAFFEKTLANDKRKQANKQKHVCRTGTRDQSDSSRSCHGYTQYVFTDHYLNVSNLLVHPISILGALIKLFSFFKYVPSGLAVSDLCHSISLLWNLYISYNGSTGFTNLEISATAHTHFYSNFGSISCYWSTDKVCTSVTTANSTQPQTVHINVKQVVYPEIPALTF